MSISRKHAAGLGWVLSAAAGVILAIACHAPSTAEPRGRGGGGETVRVTEADDGREVSLAVEGRLEVSLPSTPGTGYRWVVVEIVETVLDAKAVNEGAVQGGETLGGPSVQTFPFVAKARGRSPLSLAYSRPWEPIEKASKRFRIEVVVR